MTRRFAILFLMCLIVLPTLSLLAQSPVPTTAADHFDHELRDLIGQKEKVVHGWEREAKYLLWLTVMIAVLGAVAGLLQGGPDRKFRRVATVFVGTLITIGTIFNNTYFEADYRTLR